MKSSEFKLNILASATFIFLISIAAENSYAGCTLTNLSVAEKPTNGEFSISVTGNDCDLDSLIGESQKNGAQYGQINLGNVIQTKLTDGLYGDLITNVTPDFNTNGDYLIIMSGRPASQTLSINAGADLFYDGKLFIDSSVTQSHGLAIYGSATINSDLVVKSASGQGTPNYFNRAIYMNGGLLNVNGNLSSLIVREYAVSTAGPASMQITNGSKVNVKEDAYLYSMTGNSVLRVESGSSFNIEGTLTLFAERVKTSLTTNDQNNYDSYALSNSSGHIDANEINIYTQGFKGIIQNGNDSTLKTKNLIIDTTLTDTKESNTWSSPNSNAILIGAGRGLIDKAELISSGSTIVIDGNSSYFSIGDDSVTSIDSLITESSKAFLSIGKDTNIKSINSDAISVSDTANAVITIKSGAIITAGTVTTNTNGQPEVENKNLILDGIGSSIINIENGVYLSGNMQLGAGSDALEMHGQVSGIINMGDDNDTANVFSWSKETTIDAGSGNNDILNIFGDISGASTYESQQLGTIFSNFNKINIKDQSVFLLNGNSIKADDINIEKLGELRVDANTKLTNIQGNLWNKGVINLDYIDSKKIQTININGNYHGDNGEIKASTIWNNSSGMNGFSESDLISISGNATGKTIVSVKDGIIGNVTLKTHPQSSTPVVTVNGDVSADAFYGVAQTTNAGEAQLSFVPNNGTTGGDFVWTLKASNGDEIYSPDVPGYATVSFSNQEMVRDSIATYRTRKGGEYNNGYDFNAWGKKGIWARTWHKSLKSHGSERLDWKSRSTGYQFGYELENSKTDKGSARSDAYISYAFSHSDAFDHSRSESGKLISNKHSGRMKTNNFNIGITRTYISDDKSYTDLVLQLSTIKNRYIGNRGTQATNRGLAVTASFEQGFHSEINDKLYIEPMYQIVAGQMRLKDFNDGYRSISQGNQWEGLLRAGGRLYFKDPVSNQQNNLVYAKAHLVHDFANKSKTQIGTSKINEKNSKQWAEVGLGFEVKNGNSTYFFLEANFDRNLGGVYRNAYSVNFGINHKW